MATAYHHALSSAKRFGGDYADYILIHNWLDETKAYVGDFRHRALRHHTFGIFEAEKKFGLLIVNSLGKAVPVRKIAEQHVIEDLGFLATPQDWLKKIEPEKWMNNPQKLGNIDLEA